MLEPKQEFKQRIESLLPEKQDREEFWKIVRTEPKQSIRCNTLKTSPEKLKARLKEKGWQIIQPFQKNPEIMIIQSRLKPGELGKTKEHLLGYYYAQEISSMMPILALNPEENDIFLDLCASPGSKTTQASALMNNRGTIIANDVDLGRIRILASNLEKCSCSNVLVSRHDGIVLCKKLKSINMKFDKILLDAPCTGEGNIRTNEKTLLMWNIKAIKKLSRLQQNLLSHALPILKTEGELLYSTCTHSPEENELVIQSLLENPEFNVEIQEINLPKEFKTRPGITEWQGEKLNKEISKARRIYPQDNNTEGFFLCKLKKLGERKE